MFLVLHRYIFRELLRIFILTTVALTLILSLGSLLRPIQEFGVGPHQVVRLLIYFLPVTLTFVLPMSALFAAALCYGRLAGDNEIDACKASGVSPLTLVYPGFILAMFVAMGNLALSFHVMPNYILKAEQAIKADVRQILFRNLQRRGFYTMPGLPYSVYADNTDSENDILNGVIVVKANVGNVGEIITTEDARVSFQEASGRTQIHIDAYDAQTISQGSDMWLYMERFTGGQSFGSLLEDRISFKKVSELKQIQADPLSFRPIAKRVVALREQYAKELLFQDINDVVVLPDVGYTMTGDPNRIRITANKAELGTGPIKLSEGIKAEIYDTAGRPLQILTCDDGTLVLVTRTNPPTLTLTLKNASSNKSVGVYMEKRIKNLRLPAKIEPLFEEGLLYPFLSDDLFDDLRHGPSPDVNNMHIHLKREMHATMADLKSEVHSRLVFGLGCVPMILIGIGLGIIKRGGHMLSAFGASCVPALVLIVAMMSGKQLMSNVGSDARIGLILIWSGLVILWFIFLFVYRKLLHN